MNMSQHPSYTAYVPENTIIYSEQPLPQETTPLPRTGKKPLRLLVVLIVFLVAMSVVIVVPNLIANQVRQSIVDAGQPVSLLYHPWAGVTADEMKVARELAKHNDANEMLVETFPFLGIDFFDYSDVVICSYMKHQIENKYGIEVEATASLISDDEIPGLNLFSISPYGIRAGHFICTSAPYEGIEIWVHCTFHKDEPLFDYNDNFERTLANFGYKPGDDIPDGTFTISSLDEETKEEFVNRCKNSLGSDGFVQERIDVEFLDSGINIYYEAKDEKLDIRNGELMSMDASRYFESDIFEDGIVTKDDVNESLDYLAVMIAGQYPFKGLPIRVIVVDGDKEYVFSESNIGGFLEGYHAH